MRIARSTGAVSGLLIALLGIWGALIPFVGPYFDYSFGTNSTWHYTADRLWLNILPGALALLAGLLLLTASRRTSGSLGGWLAVSAGTWFVIGPSVSLTWESGAGPIGRPLFGSTRQMLEFVWSATSTASVRWSSRSEPLLPDASSRVLCSATSPPWSPRLAGRR